MILEANPFITVYTDGSASHKDKTGGWAFVAYDKEGNEELASGHVPDPTTSNRMEQYACIVALLQLYIWYGACEVMVRSDSKYVILGITNPKRARYKNVDLWDELEFAVSLHSQVKFKHVKGHNGCVPNQKADKLAGIARKRGV